jgi:hypothetical protein
MMKTRLKAFFSDSQLRLADLSNRLGFKNALQLRPIGWFGQITVAFMAEGTVE